MTIIVKNNKCVARVGIATILYIEKVGRKLHLVTDNRDYSYYEKMSTIESNLNSTFFLCRKGCYINFDRVTVLADRCVHFDNGMKYWLGRDSFNRTRNAFIRYLGLNMDKNTGETDNSVKDKY